MSLKTLRVLTILLPVLMTFRSWGGEQKRPITVEDCVRTRRILLEAAGELPPVQLSPDGLRVAYVVKSPNIISNRNDYQLYIRDLSQLEQRENVRLILQADHISGTRWIGPDQLLAQVGRRHEGTMDTEIDIIDTKTGTTDRVDFRVTIEEFSVSADGKIVAFSHLVASQEQSTAQIQAQQSRKERGYPIRFEEGTGEVQDLPRREYEIYLGTIGSKGKVDATKLYFSGPADAPRRSSLRDVERLNLSPNGKYLLFNYSPNVLPSGWEDQPLIKELRSFGGGGGKQALGLYDIASGQLRLGFNFDGGYLRTSWAGDSRAYSVISPSPFGSPEGNKETEDAISFGRIYYYLYRFTHLFTVDVGTGAVAKVVDRDSGLPGNLKFLFDDPLQWKRGGGEMIVRVSDKTFGRMKMTNGRWQEVGRFEVAGEDNQFRSMFATDGNKLVGLSQTLTVPPDLFVQEIGTGRIELLTDLNPEYRSIVLGEVEKIQWTNQYGSRCSGKLIKPVGYVPGKRYPLVLIASNTDDDVFISDLRYTTAFAPQVLADSGFVVLMTNYPREDKFRKGDFPGEMGDAYNWMSMMESAIDLLSQKGLVDRSAVGIGGFSRTAWLTDFALTHSSYSFTAASSADSGIYNYGGYFRYNNLNVIKGAETQVGGPPYGETRKLWLENAPPFNAERVKTAMLMEYTGTAEHGFEFFVALSRLGKPVQLYRYPNGGHPFDTPFERIASLKRNVDWFRFWMQGYEGNAPDYDAEQFVRWRRLREQREWIDRMSAQGKDPTAEFLRQTAPGALVTDADRAPAVSDVKHQ